MAEWRVRNLELPPGLQEITDTAATVTSSVATFLDAVQRALEVAAAFAQPAFDAYSAIVNALVDELQGFINDINETGVSVLVDYPQNLNVTQFNPASRATLAGTLVDTSNLQQKTSDDVRRSGGQNRLQAVVTKRRVWNPSSRDLLSYDEAVLRITRAFDDREDPLRPVFTDNANTVGVVIMTYSQELGTWLRLVSALNDLFSLDDLSQVIWPGFEDWFDEFSGPITELTQEELDLLDLTAPIDSRGGGEHPNFVLNTRLGDLIPTLGDILETMIQLLESFRPNGDIAEFVQNTINAIESKIQRLQRVIDALSDLTDQLRNAFQGMALASVVVESQTGNSGFIQGLQRSTGHPQFDDALVLSLVIYAGGPGGQVLKQLFGSAGTALRQSTQESLAAARAVANRPLERP